jgi:DDB1- and CUL4-associated factor 4
MPRQRFSRSHYQTNQQKRFNNRNSRNTTHSRSNNQNSSNTTTHPRSSSIDSSDSSQSSPIDSSSSSSLTRSHEIPREIPGYYYDHEKDRYFKIMPNKSVGSNHLFSADSIGTKKKRAEEVKDLK